MQVNKWIYFLLGLILTTACTPSELSYLGYLEFASDRGDEFRKEIETGDFKFTVEHVPSELMCYRELKNGEHVISQQSYDSLWVSGYEHSSYFVLTMAPSDRVETPFDVTYWGVGDYETFKERMLQMNFELGDHLWLEAGGQKIEPAGVEMENLYGLKPERKFMIVFDNRQEWPEDQVSLVYQDDFFYTGISKFHFPKNALIDKPKLKIEN